MLFVCVQHHCVLPSSSSGYRMDAAGFAVGKTVLLLGFYKRFKGSLLYFALLSLLETVLVDTGHICHCRFHQRNQSQVIRFLKGQAKRGQENVSL